MECIIRSGKERHRFLLNVDLLVHLKQGLLLSQDKLPDFSPCKRGVAFTLHKSVTGINTIHF